MAAKFTFLSKKEKSLKINLDKEINNFLQTKKIEKRSDRTIETYNQTLRQFQEWVEAQSEDDISTNIMKEYINYLSFEKSKWDDHPTKNATDKGLSARSVNNLIRNLKIYFNYLVQERIISSSPLESINYEDTRTHYFRNDSTVC